ncbi:MAG: histidine kinase, partial [Lachnospiraceae bacterium]|nr:histidine kinase [Lachnospiraceae bacterium]
MGLTSAGALIVFIILTALLGANLLLIFLLIRQRKKSERQRDDIEEKDTRIEELQTSIALSQIKPHFLYNSLNTIYVLCGKDLSKGRQAISDLSDYLRSNIGSIDSRLPIPFEEEMEHVKKYLA